MRTFFVLASAFGIGLSSAAPANASDNLPAPIAKQLDERAAEYAWSTAAERRHMIMRETMRQQRYGHRGYAYGLRYGYGPRPGYYRPYRGW